MQCKQDYSWLHREANTRVTGRLTAVLYLFTVMPVTVFKQGVEHDTI